MEAWNESEAIAAFLSSAKDWAKSASPFGIRSRTG
jgi:hypothetical protein